MAGARKSTARRYAEAIFEIAERDGNVEAWLEQLTTISTAVSGDQIVRALEDPSVPIERRLGMLDKALGEGMVPQMHNLLALIVRRRRVESLPDHRARIPPPLQQEGRDRRGDGAQRRATRRSGAGCASVAPRADDWRQGRAADQCRCIPTGWHPGPARRPSDRRLRPWPSRTTSQSPRVRRAHTS